MNKNEAIVVCAPTGSLVMYITNNTNDLLYNWFLYDGNDMNNLIGDLGSDSITSSSVLIPRSIKSSSGCFTLYSRSKRNTVGKEQYTVLFQIYDENCQNTVFQIPYSEYNLKGVTFKTSTSKCNAIILSTVSDGYTSLPYVNIVGMNTTTKNDTFIFKSLANDRKFFEVQSPNLYQWKEMILYTISLNIIIPPSSDFSIHFTAGAPILQLFDNNVQRGIMASPSYSGFMHTFPRHSLYWVDLANWRSGSFIATTWKGNPDFLLEVDGNNHTFVLNQNISFYHSYQFFARCQEDNPSQNEFLIEFVINDIYSSVTTTSTTTTLKTTLKPTSTSLSTTMIATTTKLTPVKSTSQILLTSSTSFNQTTTTSSTSTTYISTEPPTILTSTAPTVTTSNNFALSNKSFSYQLMFFVCLYYALLEAK